MHVDLILAICNNRNKTCFSETLTQSRPLRLVKTLASQARVTIPSSGILKILLTRILYCISIVVPTKSD